MKVLLVSYYAEAHLPSSAAQNTRLLARSLAGAGHEVRVVCAAAAAGSERVDGYLLKKLPLSSPPWQSKWLGIWRPRSISVSDPGGEPRGVFPTGSDVVVALEDPPRFLLCRGTSAKQCRAEHPAVGPVARGGRTSSQRGLCL